MASPPTPGWSRPSPGSSGKPAVDRWWATCPALASDIHVMDALWAGEGRGSIGNTPVWVGCVLASTDPIALDVTTARLLGVPEDLAAGMTYAREAASRGLGTASPAEIAIVGKPFAAARTPIQHHPVDLSFSYLAPVRVIVGEGVSVPGTVGHFKSVADVWHKDRVCE